MAADIGGMALWRLGVRCTEMDSRRRRLLSGVMVTSMAEWPYKVEASICSEDGPVEDGGDDTRVRLTGLCPRPGMWLGWGFQICFGFPAFDVRLR